MSSATNPGGASTIDAAVSTDWLLPGTADVCRRCCRWYCHTGRRLQQAPVGTLTRRTRRARATHPATDNVAMAQAPQGSDWGILVRHKHTKNAKTWRCRGLAQALSSCSLWWLPARPRPAHPPALTLARARATYFPTTATQTAAATRIARQQTRRHLPSVSCHQRHQGGCAFTTTGWSQITHNSAPSVPTTISFASSPTTTRTVIFTLFRRNPRRQQRLTAFLLTPTHMDLPRRLLGRQAQRRHGHFTSSATSYKPSSHPMASTGRWCFLSQACPGTATIFQPQSFWLIKAAAVSAQLLQPWPQSAKPIRRSEPRLTAT
eukprot:m.88749 g.88749  ORF g.88749 m.88749 type:complete len:319 (-) comp14953_c0_seq3:1102-2058(-)